MRIVILAEHGDGALREEPFRAAVAAAREIAAFAADGVSIEGLVLAAAAGESIAAEAAKVAGVSKVALVAGDSLRAGADENAALALAAAAADADYVVAVSSAYARAVMPRAAALADSQMISEAIAIEAADTFARPIYAGNAVAVVKSADARRFLSVRQTAFAPIEGENDSPAPIESAAAPADSGLSEHIEEVATDLSRPELSAAKIVVSGGRGVGSADNFKMLEKLADKLGAALGASRAAVDAGYVPNDYQVGQTGKIVAPDLYVAVGISGAIQHLAGMKDSKCIVAINKDADAPIFEIADYGLVGDLFEIVPALEAAL